MRFRQRLAPRVEVSLVPMIDVVFQLVVFFMVSTTFILTPGVDLVFPESSSSEPVIMSKLVITVVSRDEVYLNKEQFDLQGLDAKLQELSQQEEEDVPRTVVLEGDRSIPYELLVSVLDILRLNGYRGINLRTRER
jgi:biopolymer transport protein ExbD